MRLGRVWQRRELGAREVVAVHGDEGRDGLGRAAGRLLVVEGIEARREVRSEGGLA